MAVCFQVQNAFSIQANKTDNQTIYDNWIKVQAETSLSSDDHSKKLIFDKFSEKYYALYRETGQNIYLQFSLYEAGHNKRQEIVNRLSESEINTVSNTLAILNGNISSDTYSIRPYSPEDLYLFYIISIPDSLQEEAEGLLNYWKNTLEEDLQENPIEGAFKAQTLIYGYDGLNDFQKVFEVGRHLIVGHPFPNSLFTFDLFSYIAYSARTRGYYSVALKIYEKNLIPIARIIDDQEKYLTVRFDYANTLFRFGNVRNALNEYEYVYSQGIQNLDPRYRPALLNNLAISYLNAGQFDQYVQFQLEAFEIAREEDNNTQQLEILGNLFNYYRRQNEIEVAFNYLNQALQIAQENNLLSRTSSILLSLGIYTRDKQKNLAGALEHFHEALVIANESNEYQQQINSYIDLSETYLMLNEYDQSEKYITEAIRLSRSRDDSRNFVYASVRYANVLVEQNRFEEAQNVMQEFSLESLEQIPFYAEILGRNVNTRLLAHSGEMEKAVERSSTAIEEILNWLRESTDLQTGHMRMDEEFSEAFRLHTDLLYKLGRFEEAVAVADELRNLSRAGFYNNPLLKSQILSEEELIRDYNLSNRIEDLRSRYAAANEDQKVFLSNQLAEAISERNSLQSQAFPNYNESSFDNPLPLAMEKLDSDQMVVYFSVFENQVFQFFVSKKSIDMKAYPAENKYLDLLENAVGTMGHDSTDLNLLYEVYQTFYEGNIPEQIHHLYIIPDGIFYRLPVEILPVEPAHTSNSYGSSTYLIENYSVSYLNTLSDLITESPDADFSFDMAGFSVSNFSAAGHPELPDLPFSPQEVTDSAEKLEKFTNNRFFIDENSTETNFREIAGKAKIIHLATHSKVNDESPLFSSLYLHAGSTHVSGDSIQTENDGIIHAYELFDLNLNANLIFLSSCESGTGGYLKGSGILGFSRAFTYAGAQSLSINLWPIRDQTASEISLRFYEALNEGKNKADALREARLSYLNNRNSDPYLWGAFIMYGNIESPVNSNQFFIQLLVSGVLITGLFLAVFAYQKKSLIKSWIL